jgi:hypothetical protein
MAPPWFRSGLAKINRQTRTCGGVTDWKGMGLCNHHWVIPPLESLVRRKISHVLEHGDRPVPCSEKLDFPHLPVDSLLPLKKPVLLDVAFHSFSCRTNWGRRQLNCKEIAGAMDLPFWFSSSPLFDNWFDRHSRGNSMPLKPFQALALFFKSSPEVAASA